MGERDPLAAAGDVAASFDKAEENGIVKKIARGQGGICRCFQCLCHMGCFLIALLVIAVLGLVLWGNYKRNQNEEEKHDKFKEITGDESGRYKVTGVILEDTHASGPPSDRDERR